MRKIYQDRERKVEGKQTRDSILNTFEARGVS